MGYHTTAIADLSMAVTISPALSSIALFNRGICYQAIGDAEKVLYLTATHIHTHSGTSLLWTQLGLLKVSRLKRCPYFRGRLVWEC